MIHRNRVNNACTTYNIQVFHTHPSFHSFDSSPINEEFPGILVNMTRCCTTNFLHCSTQSWEAISIFSIISVQMQKKAREENHI